MVDMYDMNRDWPEPNTGDKIVEEEEDEEVEMGKY